MPSSETVELESCQGGYCLKITNGHNAGMYLSEYGQVRYQSGAKVFPGGTPLGDVVTFAQHNGYELVDYRLTRQE
jgi:hypothetical protein